VIDVYSRVVASLRIKAVGSWLVEEQSLLTSLFLSFRVPSKSRRSSASTRARTTTRIAFAVARLLDLSRLRSDSLDIAERIPGRRRLLSF
jgi:hypothetical protein